MCRSASHQGGLVLQRWFLFAAERAGAAESSDFFIQHVVVWVWARFADGRAFICRRHPRRY